MMTVHYLSDYSGTPRSHALESVNAAKCHMCFHKTVKKAKVELETVQVQKRSFIVVFKVYWGLI